jgi:uncharacterized RDD family membrane protein YckC
MSSFESQGFGEQSSSAAGDWLSVETPEQVALQFNVAGLGSRFVAILLDQLIILAFYVVVGLALVVVFAGVNAGSGGGDSPLDTAGKWLVAVVIFVNFLMIWGYFVLFEAFWHGQTPGKRAMKLRVIKDSGRQITLFESMARNLLRVVDYLPGAYLVGVITMLCSKNNKRLGDLAAGTLVVHEQLEEQPLLYQSTTTLVAPTTFGMSQQPWAQATTPWQPGTQAMFAADAVARLGAQDLVVIEAFFARMLDLPMETRAALAYRIAGQMAAKMGVALPEGNPERALESMAFQMRGSGQKLSR